MFFSSHQSISTLTRGVLSACSPPFWFRLDTSLASCPCSLSTQLLPHYFFVEAGNSCLGLPPFGRSFPVLSTITRSILASSNYLFHQLTISFDTSFCRLPSGVCGFSSRFRLKHVPSGNRWHASLYTTVFIALCMIIVGLSDTLCRARTSSNYYIPDLSLYLFCLILCGSPLSPPVLVIQLSVAVRSLALMRPT